MPDNLLSFGATLNTHNDFSTVSQSRTFRTDQFSIGNLACPRSLIRDHRAEGQDQLGLMSAAGKARMIKLSRAEAEELAEQVADQLRPQIVRIVADLLAGQDDEGISPRDLARIQRSAMNFRRKMEGLPPDRRRKVG